MLIQQHLWSSDEQTVSENFWNQLKKIRATEYLLAFLPWNLKTNFELRQKKVWSVKLAEIEKCRSQGESQTA